MKGITDIHAHVFPDAIAAKAADSIGAFYGLPVRYDGRLDPLLDMHREAGISRGCIHAVAVTPHTISPINRFIASAVREHPGRLVGYAAIHPDAADLGQVIREARELGLRGFKIHPDMQKFALDSVPAMNMFSALEAAGMPVIIHTGDCRYRFSGPEKMKTVAEAFPGLQCLCAHLGGWSEWAAAQRALTGFENVWTDTSSSLYAMDKNKARSLIRRYDRHRVMFGSDYPMWNPKEELERFLALGLTDEENELILRKNPDVFLNAAP